MDKQRRRDIAQAYKERKVPMGIFRLRCEPTGETWVGMSRNLDGAENSAMFSLRLGSARNATLLAACKAHGVEAFSFAILETLGEDMTPIGQQTWLKERDRHWRMELDARPMVG